MTTNTVDVLNRTTQVKDPANGLTKFTFDAHDNVTSVIDPKNQTTSYTDNGLDQVTAEVSPNRGMSNDVYGASGNNIGCADAFPWLRTCL